MGTVCEVTVGSGRGVSEKRVVDRSDLRQVSLNSTSMSSASNGPSAYVIRRAKPEDCAAVMRLIKELAEYDKMPDWVDMTEEKLQRDAFCDSPLVHLLVAICTESQQIVGYSSFSYLYSSWKGKTAYLDDVYVTPTHRGKGLGTSLMQAVAQCAVERGCTRMNWIVLSWKERVKKLYASVGGESLTVEKGWEYITLFQEQLQKFASEYTVKCPENVQLLVQL